MFPIFLIVEQNCRTSLILDSVKPETTCRANAAFSDFFVLRTQMQYKNNRNYKCYNTIKVNAK